MFKVYYKGNVVAEYETKESCGTYIQEELRYNKEMRREDFEVYELVENTYEDNINDYYEEEVEELFDEEYEDNNEDEEEMNYEPLETLKGVGVKDTENGIEIMLMGMTSGLLQKYEIIMNIKNYDETDLFNICYEISNEVKNLYYNNNGVPSETQVKEVVRNIMAK